jgi:hypothetical protein
MAWKRYDIFLSYSRADSERIRPLLDELRALGYRVFFDVQSIEPGQPWKRRLERAIRASRVLVLCWSDSARASDYITFEYSRAEALGRPIYPWLLDQTSLPAMLELQGIADPDGARVARKLRPYLGWTLGRRRLRMFSTLSVIALLLGVIIWHRLHPPPPPPWSFQGIVQDRETRLGIAGVEVDLTAAGRTFVAYTNNRGLYTIQLPQPMPESVDIEVRKQGYVGDKSYQWMPTQFKEIDLERIDNPTENSHAR